jgi:AmmeMemoRadiSam system protein B
LFIVLGILLLLFFFKKNTVKKITGTHVVTFYDEKSFLDGIAKVKSSYKEKDYKIKGGIVPHHLLPSYIVADFFKHIAHQKPKTLILIGPNHYEKGDFNALTSTYQWQTVYGTIKPDLDIIQKLIDQHIIMIDEKTLPNDHAISGVIPFIAYYSPDVKIVPILLSGKLNRAESKKIADTLSAIINDNTILIAPVDFSHYLISSKAKEKDKITQQVMENFDYKTLYSLNNDYLDSPPSIGILLMSMQKINATHNDVLFHTNSGEIEKKFFAPSTSYFSMFYY